MANLEPTSSGSFTQKRIEHLDDDHRAVSKAPINSLLDAFGGEVRSEMRYRLLCLATRDAILVVPRRALSTAETFGDVGADGVGGLSQLGDIQQTLPRPGVDQAIDFVRNEIGGFEDGNSTTGFPCRTIRGGAGVTSSNHCLLYQLFGTMLSCPTTRRFVSLFPASPFCFAVPVRPSGPLFAGTTAVRVYHRT